MEPSIGAVMAKSASSGRKKSQTSTRRSPSKHVTKVKPKITKTPRRKK